LDKLLYVPLPTPEDRVSILKAISGGINLSPDVDLGAIGTSDQAEGYSGADCAALLREAGLAVLKEDVLNSKENSDDSTLCILPRHFDYAFKHVVPSVSRKDQARYHKMRDRMAHARSRGAVVGETTTEDGDGCPVPDSTKVECDKDVKQPAEK
jgi:ribosome biogenesis ATPase